MNGFQNGPAPTIKSQCQSSDAQPALARTDLEIMSVKGVRFGIYTHGLYEAFNYCLARPSLLGLMFIEAVFWSIGIVFNLFLLSHAERIHDLGGNNSMQFSGVALGCMGIGLLGAFGISKISRGASPIFIYTPTFVLSAYALTTLLHSTSTLAGTFLTLFAFALGAGLAKSRVLQDLRKMIAIEFHARVFSLNAVALAAAIPIALFGAAGLSDGVIERISLWIPNLLYFALPLVFVLSWMIDISIHIKDAAANIREFPGPIHLFGYKMLRAILRMIFKHFFRYVPIDALNVPETGGVVLAANHGSFVDPILLSCGTDRVVQYVMYSSYYCSFAHPLFRFLRCFPVDEHDQFASLRAGVRSLKLGACIGIFPEGKISTDGKLHTPMRGALFLAQSSGACIVPVALKGDFKLLPRGSYLPRQANVATIFGTPFTVDKGLSKRETEILTDKLMADLAQKLEVAPPPSIVEIVAEKKHSSSNIRSVETAR